MNGDDEGKVETSWRMGLREGLGGFTERGMWEGGKIKWKCFKNWKLLGLVLNGGEREGEVVGIRRMKGIGQE